MMDERRQTSRGPSRLWPFRTRDDVMTIVDLGTQKLACAIVSLSAPRFGFDAGAKNIRVLGSAVVRSSGFSGGRIANLAATETSIRRAVAQAEGEAGMTVDEVLVTGQFPGLLAETFAARLGAQGTLLREDIDAISIAAGDYCSKAQRKLLHIFMTAGESDDAGTATAESNSAEETDVVAISMPLTGARQIASCLARSLLTVRGYIAGPIASALAVTNPLERSAGVLVVDMGAQSTGYVLFVHGVPVFASCIDIRRPAHLRRDRAGVQSAQIRSRTTEDPLRECLR